MAKKNGLTTYGFNRRSEYSRYDVAYDRWRFGVFIEAAPRAMNMISSGMVPRGNEVPTPEALKHLPLKPPCRVTFG